MTAAPLIALLCALAALTCWRCVCVRVASLRPAAVALTALALADVARLWTTAHAPRLDVVLSMLWPVAAAWLVGRRDLKPENVSVDHSDRNEHDGLGVKRALASIALPLAILAYAITLAVIGRRLAAHWTLALQAPRALVSAVAAYVAVRARVRHEWPGWSPAIGCVIGLGQILALSAWGAWETTVRAMSLACWLMVAVLVLRAR